MIVYDPQYRVRGWDYYQIGQLLKILYERCDRQDVQALCDEALSREPYGLELRNAFLLPIRSGLQEWKEGTTLAAMIKSLLSRVLDDSVVGGPMPYERLRLRTVVAFDLSKILDGALENPSHGS